MKLFRLYFLSLAVGLVPLIRAQAPPVAGNAASPAAKADSTSGNESKKTAAAAPAPEKAAKAESKKKHDWYPFHGTVESVNVTASTVNLHKEGGQRVLQMDGKSTLSRQGKAATLKDVKAGDYAHGKLHKNSRNEEVITDAKFDLEAPKKEPKAKSKKGAPAETAPADKAAK